MGILASPAGAVEEPTGFEQYQLELLNRARANPTAEVTRLSGMTWGDDPSQVPGTLYPQSQPPDLNEGFPANAPAITPDAKQPLAFNLNIEQASRDYAQQLIAHNQFTHNLGDAPNYTPDNPSNTPQSRMSATGYVFTPTPSGSGENLAGTGGSDSASITAAITLQQHNNLFIDGNTTGRGHRTGMLNPDFREVGIGIAQGTTTIFGSSFPTVVSTQDFAYNAGNPFLTGVVYGDNDHDNFYTPGEGLGSITVTATPTAGGSPLSTTTFGSGGYTLQLDPGNYDVKFTGTGVNFDAGVFGISTQNIKVDDVVPEPTSLGLLLLATPYLLRRKRRIGWSPDQLPR
jgi:hypothetical protein